MAKNGFLPFEIFATDLAKNSFLLLKFLLIGIFCYDSLCLVSPFCSISLHISTTVLMSVVSTYFVEAQRRSLQRLFTTDTLQIVDLNILILNPVFPRSLPCSRLTDSSLATNMGQATGLQVIYKVVGLFRGGTNICRRIVMVREASDILSG